MNEIDVRAVFHEKRVYEEDEEKIAFRARGRGSSYEELITPFGLHGVPAAF